MRASPYADPMPPLPNFGRHLRATRLARGFRSARALALCAGVSDSDLRKYERGYLRPRWPTAQRLIRALRLTASERAEFTRLWHAAGIPPAVREATAGLAVPGLVLWKHLPEALYALPHKTFGLVPPLPDRLIADLVMAAAALLGYHHARAARPDSPTVAALRGALNEIGTCQNLPGFAAEPLRRLAASGQLVPRWHAILFAGAPSVRQAVRPLARWTYYTGFGPAAEPRVSFEPRALPPGDWPSEHVTADWWARVFSALTLDVLWRLLDLDAHFGGPPDYGYYCLPGLQFVFSRLLEFEPAQLRRRLAPPPAPIPFDSLVQYYEVQQADCLCQDAGFASQLRAAPDYAAACLGDGWSASLDQAVARAAELRPLLREAAPSAPPHQTA